MNLSVQDVVRDEGATEGCCFSNSTSSSCYYSINRLVTKDQSIALKEIDEYRLQGSTAEEREYVTNEIIGLDLKEIDECEEFVIRNLQLLENELTGATGSIRLAYDRALKMNPSFVTNIPFRIMFLRADHFDAKQAARRILLHFKYKLDLFGENKLVKEITFDDLSPLDQACLYRGSFQALLSVKDKWGRPITFIFPALEKIVSWEHSTRAQWYQVMVRMQQEESLQKFGVVTVSVGVPSKGSLPILLRRLPIITQALPFRISAWHRCLINEKNRPYLAATLIRAVNLKSRLRVQFHFEESVTSCLYNLFLYGIDPARVPLDNDGQPQKEVFLDLLEQQKLVERQQQTSQQQRLSCNHNTKEIYEQREEEQSKFGSRTAALECFHTNIETIASATTPLSAATTKYVLVVPRSHDVLLGRGLKVLSHRGNCILNKIIEMEVVSYKNATSKFDKSCIVMTTMQKMRSIGGRFLTCVDSSIGNSNTKQEKEWVLATDQKVHESISGRFRKKLQKINQS